MSFSTTEEKSTLYFKVKNSKKGRLCQDLFRSPSFLGALDEISNAVILKHFNFVEGTAIISHCNNRGYGATPGKSPTMHFTLPDWSMDNFKKMSSHLELTILKKGHEEALKTHSFKKRFKISSP
jgi:hypothetical protein